MKEECETKTKWKCGCSFTVTSGGIITIESCGELEECFMDNSFYDFDDTGQTLEEFLLKKLRGW